MRLAALASVAAIVISVAHVVLSRTQLIFGDGRFYLDIAQSLASGHGYTEPQGPWPTAPTIFLPPLWPFILSFALRLGSHLDPKAVVCYADIAMHAATVFGTTLLTWMLCGGRSRTLLAGFVAAIWPQAHLYLLAGTSEASSAAVLLAGAVLLCAGGRYFYFGVLALSLLPMVKPNFLILPVCIAVVWLAPRLWSRRSILSGCTGPKLLAAVVLFYLPAAFWIMRNYAVTGEFPIMSADEGAATLGAYNPVSAAFGPNLGAWVWPDHLPGEPKKYELAAGMSESDVMRYYRSQAKRFIVDHWRTLPLLVAAHAVRSALPAVGARTDNPGGPHMDKWVLSEWLFRIALYGAALACLWRKPSWPNTTYSVLLAATAAMTAATVLVFFFDPRFLYPLSFLLIPGVFGSLSFQRSRV